MPAGLAPAGSEARKPGYHVCLSEVRSMDPGTGSGYTEEPVSPRLLKTLNRIPGLGLRLGRVQLGTPLVGSREFQDRRVAYGGDRPGGTACLKLSVANDHLLAWRNLILEARSFPVWAHFSLLRAGIEASVQSRWLLDPAANPCERVERALGAALSDLEWLQKLEDDIARDPSGSPDHASAVTRASELKQGAREAGLTPANVDTIELLRRYSRQPLIDVVAYRYACGVLHAKLWATLGGDSETVAAGATMRTDKFTADEGMAAGMTTTAVNLFIAALRDYESYVVPVRL